jgi:methanogenic corrinoid protein MtbC1
MEISTMAEQADAEFKLSDLNDQELTEQVHDDLYNGLRVEVEEATRIFLKRGWNAEKVLNEALVEGMRIVVSTSATASCSCPKCCSPRTP